LCSKKKIALIGVGNILMGDEGAGIRVIEKLEKMGVPDNVTLFDAGTWFLDIVSELSDFDKVIIVDTTRGGGSPGTIYRFGLDDISSKGGSSISLHDFGVIESLNIERLVNRLPEDIVFYGIEPERITISLELSPRVEGVIDRLIEKLMDEIGDS